MIAFVLGTACDRTAHEHPAPTLSSVPANAPVGSAPLTDAGAAGTMTLPDPRHAFGVADANGDGVDDVLAVTHFVTSDDSERRLVAFDGKTRGVLWRSAPLRPWGAMPSRARVMVLVGGSNVALTTGWTNADFYELKSGARKTSLALEGIPGVRSCPDPKAAGRYYLELTAGGSSSYQRAGGALLDVAAAKVERAQAPDFCPSNWVPEHHELGECYFRHDSETARAKCAPLTAAPTAIPGFKPAYVVTDPDASIVVGNATGTPADTGHIMIVRFEPTKKEVQWTRAIAEIPHAEPNAKEVRSTRQVDVTSAGVLILIDVNKGYSPVAQRLIMLDTKTGAIRYEHAITAGVVAGPRVVGSRLYLPKTAPREDGPWYDPKGQLDVLDANTGAPLFSVGGGETFQ